MGKFPLIVVAALATWIGYTLYTEGPDKAFGGLFSILASEQYGEEFTRDRRSRMERLADGTAKRNPGKEPEKAWWQ